MPEVIKQYDEEQIFSCISTNNHFHETIWSILKRASFVLWHNISTTLSCNSSFFQITIQLSDAGAYLFSETTTDFTITASHPTRGNGTMRLTLDRTGYGEECNAWSTKNTSYTNTTLTLPSSPELQGASVNVTCRKQL